MALIRLINGFRQALGIRPHVPPDLAIAPMARELPRVVHPHVMCHFPQERVLQDMR
jgi:hypothetical protein